MNNRKKLWFPVIVFILLFGCITTTNKAPPPSTISTSTRHADVDEAVNLDASSVDPDGDSVSYFWSAEEGDFTNSRSASTSWTSSTEGIFIITVEASDGSASTPASVTIVVGGTVFPADTNFESANGKTILSFDDETNVVPSVENIEVQELSESELDALKNADPLPLGREILVSVDVTPDGMEFLPPAKLKFEIDEDEFEEGDEIEIYQFDEDTQKWVSVGKAKVDEEGYAVGSIEHTTVYALVRIPAGTSTDDGGDEPVATEDPVPDDGALLPLPNRRNY